MCSCTNSRHALSCKQQCTSCDLFFLWSMTLFQKDWLILYYSIAKYCIYDKSSNFGLMAVMPKKTTKRVYSSTTSPPPIGTPLLPNNPVLITKVSFGEGELQCIHSTCCQGSVSFPSRKYPFRVGPIFSNFRFVFKDCSIPEFLQYPVYFIPQ